MLYRNGGTILRASGGLAGSVDCCCGCDLCGPCCIRCAIVTNFPLLVSGESPLSPHCDYYGDTYARIVGGCGSATHVCFPVPYFECRVIDTIWLAYCRTDGSIVLHVELITALFSPLCFSTSGHIVSIWELVLPPGTKLNILSGNYELPLVYDVGVWDVWSSALPDPLIVSLRDCFEVPCAPQIVIVLTPDGTNYPDCLTFTYDWTNPGDCDCTVELTSTTPRYACFTITCTDGSTEERCVHLPPCEFDCSYFTENCYPSAKLYAVVSGLSDDSFDADWDGETYHISWLWSNVNIGFTLSPSSECGFTNEFSQVIGTFGDHTDPGILIRRDVKASDPLVIIEWYFVELLLEIECTDPVPPEPACLTLYRSSEKLHVFLSEDGGSTWSIIPHGLLTGCNLFWGRLSGACQDIDSCDGVCMQSYYEVDYESIDHAAGIGAPSDTASAQNITITACVGAVP